MSGRDKRAAPKRVLVFRIGSLGDILIAMPAFWRLRQAFPEANLTLLSGRSADDPKRVAAESILPPEGLFDDYLTYPDGASMADAVRMLRKVRKGKYDLLVYLMPRTRSSTSILRDRIALRAAGIKQIAGIRHLSRNRLPLNAKFPAAAVDRESDFLWDCLSSDEIEGSDWPRRVDIGLGEDERKAASEFISAELDGSHQGKRFIAVAPGSKWQSKIWPSERFVKVLRELRRDCPLVPIIFGDRFDFSIGEQILRESGGGINTAGRLSVRVSAAAMELCDFYLGNDTGAMHLAAAAGKPCVAIFAAIDWPGRWLPVGGGHRILRESIECEGCHLAECPIGNQCLKRISVEQVLEACREVLSGKS